MFNSFLFKWMNWLPGSKVQTPTAAATAKSLQSCPTLCDSIDGSPPGSPVPGILQARTLEWVAISFSNAWKWRVKVKSLSCVWLFATLWTAAFQAPPSMGFSRQESWSGVPLPTTTYISYILSYKWFIEIGKTDVRKLLYINSRGRQEADLKWPVNLCK